MKKKTTKNKPNLIVDTRERAPWRFEEDNAFNEVIYSKLDAGDYSIEGMENIFVIERKASADELFNNFTKDRKRLFAEFDRLVDCPYKMVIVEQTWEEILDPENYYVNRTGINKRSHKMPVAVVATNLNKLMLEHSTYVILAGNKAQSVAKNLLLEAYELHQKGKLIEVEGD